LVGDSVESMERRQAVSRAAWKALCWAAMRGVCLVGSWAGAKAAQMGEKKAELMAAQLVAKLVALRVDSRADHWAATRADL
jgi:hypothetical protein